MRRKICVCLFFCLLLCVRETATNAGRNRFSRLFILGGFRLFSFVFKYYFYGQPVHCSESVLYVECRDVHRVQANHHV